MDGYLSRSHTSSDHEERFTEVRFAWKGGCDPVLHPWVITSWFERDCEQKARSAASRSSTAGHAHGRNGGALCACTSTRADTHKSNYLLPHPHDNSPVGRAHQSGHNTCTCTCTHANTPTPTERQSHFLALTPPAHTHSAHRRSLGTRCLPHAYTRSQAPHPPALHTRTHARASTPDVIPLSHL